MKFSQADEILCKRLFSLGKSTGDVQEILMSFYPGLPRCRTSNFIKHVRKSLGIYGSKKNSAKGSPQK